MVDIDKVVINFDADQMVIMNIVLGLLMFGVALNLKLSDFRYLLKRPKAVLVGLSCQLILLPLLTLVIIFIWQPPFSISLGMLLIAACPGGNISNYFVFRARGNAALSITLTSLVTIAAVLITPLSFLIWTSLLERPTDFDYDISLRLLDMLKIVVQLILIPLVAGMAVNHYLPAVQRRIEKFMKVLSLVLLLGVIFFGVKDNLPVVNEYLDQIFLLVLLHNGLAYLTGYGWGSMWRMPESDRRAIAMETGIQNGGLGLILALNYFEGLGGMILVAAWWGIWDIISGFALSTFWSHKGTNTEQKV